MDIVIHSMGMPFNGETVKTQSLGGSESAAYYLAKEMASQGHYVRLFTSSQEEGEWDGVKYIYHGEPSEKAPLGDRFSHYAENTPHDLLVIQRHPLAFHRDYAAKINVWQLHDLALHRTSRVISGGLPRITFTTTVSEWHKEQVKSVWGINPNNIHTVPNGVDPALYEAVRADGVRCEKAAYVRDDKSFKLLYQSRPERGLRYLLQPDGIMSRLAKSHPNVHLYICGYENTTDHMAAFYAQLAQWGNDLPNVTHLGALTKRELAEVQIECDLLCYPTDFEEVSCITAMEAMHAHLPMLSCDVGALAETCEGSGTILIPASADGVDVDAFCARLCELIDDLNSDERPGSSIIGSLKEKQRRAAEEKTWTKAANILLSLVRKEISKSTPSQMLRHYIEHGDILAAEHFASTTASDGPIFDAAKRELETMYNFSKDAKKNLAHYEHFEGIAVNAVGGVEALVSGHNGFTETTRYRGILNYVVNEVQSGATKILDFGCAYGHISIPLAKSFPVVQFTGVDHVQGSIDIANEGAKRLGLTNVSYHRGSVDDIPVVEGGYDLIIAAEVIEHIRDYIGALNSLRKHLSPEGKLLITTPIGRWEWMGHKEFKRGREHLHHFEREDINHVYKDMDLKIMCAPGGADTTSATVGSFVYLATPKDKPFNAIDYVAKHKRQVPRQTVSLCMIVKDGESDLRKSISSVIDFVDEIVIRIDSATTDDTVGVIKRLKEDNPHKTFNVDVGLSPLKDGFDAARNVTIDAASGDWILWMDADESMVGASNMFRLFRNSSVNAYAVAQHHYSVIPAQVLSTDYPCRLFRNNRGTRFYGLVHEHPEDVVGKAIEYTTHVDDIQLMHVGYTDEPTRRKRFLRNFDLLKADVEKNPDRLLNTMLMLRDTAQSIVFAKENGQPFDFVGAAHYGIHLFEKMVNVCPTRMTLDAMQYYSMCVEVLGFGFEAEVAFASFNPATREPHFAQKTKARFHNKEIYFKLCDKLRDESVSNFDSKYF